MNERQRDRQFQQWLAARMDRFFEENPGTTVQQIADQVGVSASTISRWRMAKVNVAQQHQEAMFRCLGVTRGELNRAGVTPPSARSRGPVRSRGGVRSRIGQPGRPADDFSRLTEPSKRMVFIAGQLLDRPSDHWLWSHCRSQRERLVGSVQKQSEPDAADEPGESSYRLAPQIDLLPADVLTLDSLRILLNDLRRMGEAGVALIVYLWVTLRDEDNQFVLHREAETMKLAELCELVGDAAERSLLMLETCEPGEGAQFFGHNPQTDALLDALHYPGTAVILAALPSSESEQADWVSFSDTFCEAMAGAADRNGDGTVTVTEVCAFASERIRARNLDAAHRRARGEPAVIVPPPRLVAKGEAGRLIVSTRAQRTSR